MPADQDSVNAAIERVEQVLIPAEIERTRTLIKRLLDALSPPRGIRATEDMEDWWDRNGKLYASALADLPEDLMRQAFRDTLQNFKWSRPPTPADIRASIVTELERRRLTLNRLKTAALMLGRQAATAKLDDNPMSDSDLADAVSRAAAVKAQLAALSDGKRIA